MSLLDLTYYVGAVTGLLYTATLVKAINGAENRPKIGDFERLDNEILEDGLLQPGNGRRVQADYETGRAEDQRSYAKAAARTRIVLLAMIVVSYSIDLFFMAQRFLYEDHTTSRQSDNDDIGDGTASNSGKDTSPFRLSALLYCLSQIACWSLLTWRPHSVGPKPSVIFQSVILTIEWCQFLVPGAVKLVSWDAVNRLTRAHFITLPLVASIKDLFGDNVFSNIKDYFRRLRSQR